MAFHDSSGSVEVGVGPGPKAKFDLKVLGANWKAPLAGAGGAPKSKIGLGGFFGGLAFFGSDFFWPEVFQVGGGSNFTKVECDAVLCIVFRQL